MEEQGLELAQPLDQLEISIYDLNGSLGFRTLRMIGYHSKKLLQRLVDTGSSHNFIDAEVVAKLGCPIMPTTPQLVTAANGPTRNSAKTIQKYRSK